jgi:hypothetical protein
MDDPVLIIWCAHLAPATWKMRLGNCRGACWNRIMREFSSAWSVIKMTFKPYMETVMSRLWVCLLSSGKIFKISQI